MKDKKAQNQPTSEVDFTVPGHYTGPEGSWGHGYQLHPDGSYELSPTFHDSFADLETQFSAVDRLVENVNAYATKEYSRLEKLQELWWSEAAKNVRRLPDIGRSVYDPRTNRLTFPPEEQKEKEKGD